MMNRPRTGKVSFVFGISVLLSVVFFLFDMYRSVDIAVWLFYLVPLLVTSYLAPRWISYLLLVGCTLLIGLGFVLSPSQGRQDVAILNRLITVTVLWLAIVILLGRKRVEDNLRESEERYRDLVELSPEAIYIQQDGKIAFINSAGVSLLGANSPAQLLGKPVADILHPDSRETAGDRVLMERKEIRDISALEEKYLRMDGAPVELEVSAVSVDYLGKPALQVFARDTTGRKQLEEQLRQSQKIEAVGRLAGGIAHDFNNLMTVILGYVGLMKKRMENPALVSLGLEEIGIAGERATRLTQQLVAFGRKQILQPQVLDLNSIVSNMYKMLRRLIRDDIELVMILGKQLGRVKADPGQIEQVVINLMLNARDAMPKGGRITIETANSDLGASFTWKHRDIPDGPYATLEIRDSGIGMDEETKLHIFEPYFTTKEVGKGSGLGLATVHGIIRQSGGDIRLESEPNKGTTFTIWLPRTEEVPATEPIELVLEAPPGRETILVVEDAESVRVLVRETLEDAGYRVIEASNGSEALERINQNQEPIHLMLTDVVMPKMGGRALATQVASLHPDMKILFMSGYVGDEVIGKYHPLGRRPSISKPFKPQELARKVREVLDE
jgi:PAS domain S-box-containing protein